MQFTQPNAIQTDADTEAHITALRVQIADKEVEINNLDSIIRSNKYAIEQLTGEKLELESKTNVLRNNKKELDKNILDLVSEHETALKNLDSIKVEITNSKSDLEMRKSIIEKMEEKLQLDIDTLVLERAKFEKDRAIYEEAQTKLVDKIEQLKKIIL